MSAHHKEVTRRDMFIIVVVVCILFIAGLVLVEAAFRSEQRRTDQLIYENQILACERTNSRVVNTNINYRLLEEAVPGFKHVGSPVFDCESTVKKP